VLPELKIGVQHHCDIRNFPLHILNGIDAIVHLAAISNDPIGNKYEDITSQINHKASIRLAEVAKKAGVNTFVFASSCSIYGAAEDGPRNENSPLNPLTAYAWSKVSTEQDLKFRASDDFKVTCLRFATACGMSDRLRLDLVLNDFVANAIVTGKILILSDGTPWRPLINVKDMARAIGWAIKRDISAGGNYIAVNIGSDEWNYQVKDLAEAVRDVIPKTKIEINKDAQPDKRSYRVDFGLFKSLAPEYQPIHDIRTTILELADGLESIGFNDANFHQSTLIRLYALEQLKNNGLLNENLEWTY
jgi:nucleoside-diphosphate-sugar epimerase